LLGRWLRHMLEGTLRHANITGAAKKPLEGTVGWSRPGWSGIAPLSRYRATVLATVGNVLVCSQPIRDVVIDL
jgi:hypothetical protein